MHIVKYIFGCCFVIVVVYVPMPLLSLSFSLIFYFALVMASLIYTILNNDYDYYY